MNMNYMQSKRVYRSCRIWLELLFMDQEQVKRIRIEVSLSGKHERKARAMNTAMQNDSKDKT